MIRNGECKVISVTAEKPITSQLTINADDSQDQNGLYVYPMVVESNESNKYQIIVENRSLNLMEITIKDCLGHISNEELNLYSLKHLSEIDNKYQPGKEFIPEEFVLSQLNQIYTEDSLDMTQINSHLKPTVIRQTTY